MVVKNNLVRKWHFNTLIGTVDLKFLPIMRRRQEVVKPATTTLPPTGLILSSALSFSQLFLTISPTLPHSLISSSVSLLFSIVSLSSLSFSQLSHLFISIPHNFTNSSSNQPSFSPFHSVYQSSKLEVPTQLLIRSFFFSETRFHFHIYISPNIFCFQFEIAFPPLPSVTFL